MGLLYGCDASRFGDAFHHPGGHGWRVGDLRSHHRGDHQRKVGPAGHLLGLLGVRANAQQPRLFVGMILILIFAEALGLYGLIVGLVVASTATEKGTGLCTSYKR